mgnify:CR=1 FL=1|tara:strand:- start:3257 stop:4282 length:1026 start_codon:yes stop_codon:yes gene_type:complete
MDKTINSYKKSGVNIDLGNKFVKHISKLTKLKGNNSHALLSKNIGSFGAIYDIGKLNYKNPLIVSSTDGVGTKLELSNKFRKFDTIGIDLVAMCVNDIIVLGAKPIFFLDYMALNKIELKKTKEILKGIMRGCELSNCSLIGGETAEMPGVYEKNKFDLAGFSVGIVEKSKILSPDKVKDGDIILGIPSSGIHSNGYSLVRSILKKKKINNNLKKNLLKPTKIYVPEILKIVDKNYVNAAANITGGGITENIIRSVPDNFTVNIDLSKIKIHQIFRWIKKSGISDKEMLRTFNCGVGFCLIINKKFENKIKNYFSKDYKPYYIGFISKGNKKLKLQNNLKW